MKGRWHLLIPVIALLFQVVPPVFLRVVPAIAYAEPQCMAESWERPVSLLGLAFCAGVSLLLGNLGVYELLTRSRLRTAIVLIVVCCIPALIGGALYGHALLVFLTLV